MCLSNSTYAEALNLIDIDGDWRDATEWPDSQYGKDRTLHEEDGKTETYDSLLIRHYAPITNSQFTIKVLNSAQLSISGSTSGESYSDDNSYIANSYGYGTYLIYATGNSSVALDGDVDLTIRHSLESVDQLDSIGANLLYASSGSAISIG